MTNPDDLSDPERQPEIGTTGWVFGGFVAIIIVLIALLAHKNNKSLIANSSVSQAVRLAVSVSIDSNCARLGA